MILENDIFNEELNKIKYDRQFVFDCINSCKTNEQRVNALKLINNFNSKWSNSVYINNVRITNCETFTN